MEPASVLVFGYIRVSTKGQANDGYGLEEQRDQIAAYCESQGWTLLRIYQDAGISGAKVDEEDMVVDRAGIQDLMGDLPDSGVTFVVTLTTSRLWRSEIAKILIQRELKRHTVDVRAVDRPTYSIYNLDKDPSAFLINGMMELLDQYERLEISMKLRRGRRKKASLGGYAGGGTGMGYTIRKGSKVLELDEKKVATVVRVFALKDSNPRWSNQRIAETLNGEGHTTVQGKPFQRKQVQRILDRRDFYSGAYSYADIEAAEGQHTPILSAG